MKNEISKILNLIQVGNTTNAVELARAIYVKNPNNIDLPIKEIKWLPLPIIEGKIYADMVIDLLNQDSIPHYIKMDWTSSAYLVEAASLPNQVIRIFVPKEHLKKASSIAHAILGINK